jgi:RNA polymerase sigma factor (sigma-70 family)
MTKIAQVTTQHKPTKRERKESNAALINTMRTGSSRAREEAYASLYSEYIGFLRYFFSKSIKNSSIVDDLAIESIGKAFSKLDMFDTDYAFSTWMQKIATNMLIDFKRKQEIEVQSFEELSHSDGEGKKYGFEAESDCLKPDQIIERKSSHEDLHKKISKLKPRYRELLEMRFMKEFSMKEIAEALDTGMGTIKAQLFRAKEALAMQYEK